MLWFMVLKYTEMPLSHTYLHAHWSVPSWSVRLTATIAVMSAQLLSRLLQSVLTLECTAQAVFSVGKSDHVCPLLHELHWLRVPDRIRSRLCVLVVMVDRCLHSTAPTYLADSLRRTADVDALDGRCRLRSSVSDTLVMAPTNRSTLGDRAFPVAA